MSIHVVVKITVSSKLNPKYVGDHLTLRSGGGTFLSHGNSSCPSKWHTDKQ